MSHSAGVNDNNDYPTLTDTILAPCEAGPQLGAYVEGEVQQQCNVSKAEPPVEQLSWAITYLDCGFRWSWRWYKVRWLHGGHLLSVVKRGNFGWAILGENITFFVSKLEGQTKFITWSTWRQIQLWREEWWPRGFLHRHLFLSRALGIKHSV